MNVLSKRGACGNLYIDATLLGRRILLKATPNLHPERKQALDFSYLSDDDMEALVDLERVPRHIAIIMDGNGRWATRRGLSRIEGHRAAVDAVWETVDESSRLQTEALTLYAFSSENWKRPASEVKALMGLFRSQLRKQTPRLDRNNVTLRAIGDLQRLPLNVRWELNRSIRRLRGNDGLALTLALSYSGRQELVRAVQAVARDVEAGRVSAKEINEAAVARRLDTEPLPDPDLIIRTSGEMRLSNFLLWQSAYARVSFHPNLLARLPPARSLRGGLDLPRRDRRFGAVHSVEGSA